MFLCIEHTRDHPLRLNPLGLIALPCDQQCLHLATANVSARVPKKHRKLTEPKNARLRRLAPNTAPPAQGCNELGYVGLLMDHVKPFSLQLSGYSIPIQQKVIFIPRRRGGKKRGNKQNRSPVKTEISPRCITRIVKPLHKSL